MASDRDQEADVKLARDEFTVERRRLKGHPEAVKAESRLDVEDDYGNVTTWVIDLFRLEGRVTAFVQRGAPDGYTRMVIPPKVTAAIGRHFGALASKHRRKVARRSIADLRAASGEHVEDRKPGRRRRKQGKA